MTRRTDMTCRSQRGETVCCARLGKAMNMKLAAIRRKRALLNPNLQGAMESRLRSLPALFIVFLTFSSCLFAREEYTRVFDKTVSVQSGQRFILEHSLGDIEIRTHNRPDVVIHADIRVSASDWNDARSFADNIAILVEPSSSLLSVRTRYPERPQSFFGTRNISYTVRYDITMPETLPVEVRSSFGAVSVTGVKAACDIKASHGDLLFRDGRGNQRLVNSFASIRISNNNGDVAIENGNGAVTASSVTGALTLRDRFGSVTVSDVSKGAKIVNNNGSVDLVDSGGPSSVDNSFGAVNVSNLKGDLVVNNTNGKVEANNVSGSATLNSGFGAIRFSNIGGAVSVNNRNGSVSGRNASGSVKVNSSFGQVDVGDIRGGADITASNGTVNVTNVTGSTAVRTSFGLVHVENTGSLTVRNGNAGVKASGIKGDATVNTSFGPVLLDGVGGAVSVGNQNGVVDVVVTGASCRPIEIHTSFSPVRLQLPDHASYRVTASTSFGKIKSDLPLNVSGNLAADSITGTIGGGQCPLQISNRNGDISITKR